MSDKDVKLPIDPGKPLTQAVPQQEAPSVNTVASNGTNPDEKKNSQNNHERNLPADRSRRSFMGRAGGFTAMAVAAAMVPLEPLLGGKATEAEASDIVYSENSRSNQSFDYRKFEAQAEKVSPPVAPDNGDFALYTDHSGTWSKAWRWPAGSGGPIWSSPAWRIKRRLRSRGRIRGGRSAAGGRSSWPNGTAGPTSRPPASPTRHSGAR